MASNFTPRLVFRQLFDKETSTYTYLLGDSDSGEAVLIDPVFKQADRDKKVADELGLKLKYVMNTHVHADHVTGTGFLKKILGASVKSVISVASKAEADVKLQHGDNVEFGKFSLEARSTPGHTSGCVSYVFHQARMVFTGDTVLIRGCGSTDFQDGSAEVLYNSVKTQIFTLDDDFLLYPAHDYKGMTCSSVGEEKKFNPTLSKDLDTFKKIMENLGLPYPKQ